MAPHKGIPVPQVNQINPSALFQILFQLCRTDYIPHIIVAYLVSFTIIICKKPPLVPGRPFLLAFLLLFWPFGHALQHVSNQIRQTRLAVVILAAVAAAVLAVVLIVVLIVVVAIPAVVHIVIIVFHGSTSWFIH